MRAHLGALGVLAEVTLRCRDAFAMVERAEPARFDAMLERLPELAGEARHVKLWWWPHTEAVRLWRYEETDAWDGRSPPLTREHLRAYGGGALLWLAAKKPEAIPALKRVLVPRLNRPYERADRADRVFNHPVPMKHLEMEYALAAGCAADALRELRAFIERSGIVVDFLVEVRFVAADDGWLSPAHGRDSVYIGAFMYRDGGWRRYFGGFEALAAAYDGRPHWGKVHFRDAEYLRGVYPEWDSFAALRDELDPAGVFLNPHLERVLGTRRLPGRARG